MASLIDSQVVLKDLSKAEFNGRRGTAVSFDEAKGRIGVKLDGGGSVAVKLSNLQLVVGKELVDLAQTREAQQPDAATGAQATTAAVIRGAGSAQGGEKGGDVVDVSKVDMNKLLEGDEFDGVRGALILQGARPGCSTPRDRTMTGDLTAL
eukprot:5307607-Prymnesium_polylepis.1